MLGILFNFSLVAFFIFFCDQGPAGVMRIVKTIYFAMHVVDLKQYQAAMVVILSQLV